MSDQHIVPQQMIRRFANRQGELAELIKPDLVIASRMRRPKGILWKKDYYKDAAGDLDDVFKIVEQRFAHIYPEIASPTFEGGSFVGERGATVVDWIASLLCRTQALVEMTSTIASKEGEALGKLARSIPQVFTRAARLSWYDETRDLMTRPAWRWRCIRIKTDERFLLTDNPAVLTTKISPPGFAVIAPLSGTMLILGGSSLPTTDRPTLINEVNLWLAAWAHSRIYAAQRQHLQRLVGVLQGDTPWAAQARKPLCGQRERIMAMRSPSLDEAEQFWTEFKDELGPSIFPNQQ